MIVLDSGDILSGDAAAATVVDYSVYGLDNNVLKQMADGQLSDTPATTMYTADSVDVASTIILVNTDSVARVVNLYMTPSAGTARRLIPKDMSLGIGYSLHWSGDKITVLDLSGAIATSISGWTDGATTEILIGGGAGSQPAWTTATGTGAPVRGTAPTLTAATLAGTLSCADNVVARPKLIDYGESVNAIGSAGGGTQDIDLELGNVVSMTIDTSETTLTFSNAAASGTASSFTLILTNGGSQTVNWPASVDWAGGTAPTLTTSGVDVLTFTTVDAGTIWYGFAAGLAMA